MIYMVEHVEGEPVELGLSNNTAFANWFSSVSLVRRALRELGFYKSDISKLCRETGRSVLSQCLNKDIGAAPQDYWPDFIEVSGNNASDIAKQKITNLAESNMFAVSDDLVVWATGESLFIGQREIET